MDLQLRGNKFMHTRNLVPFEYTCLIEVIENISQVPSRVPTLV